ncbi:MAG: hypothetical protein HRU38_05495 [Saccharospirillaceae bacterium]|nr:aspartate/glutamate racemase family protein [Pseudomonadales bacterium]NRB78111.1 hypothetical protein [Saccharospirillaceae bacterium]
MKYAISFIHTASVHINTFNTILADLAPQLTINHIVDESLLTYAQQHGVDSVLKQKVNTMLAELSLQSKVIVITCSSIGAIAENIGQLNGCVIQRIDRAMADFSVQNGNNILVVASLESTLTPTHDLLKSSVLTIGKTPKFTVQCIDNAWDNFVKGDMEAYYADIIKVLKLSEQKYDLIVLAQASMAGVESSVELSIPLVSSPILGVKKAISVL